MPNQSSSACRILSAISVLDYFGFDKNKSSKVKISAIQHQPGDRKMLVLHGTDDALADC